MVDRRAATIATVCGTVLQLGMVLSGHTNSSIAQLFAEGGMGISLVAGLLYGKLAHQGSAASYAVGGLIAGGVCALLGILVSFYLGDVPAMILAVGTAGSAVAGALGGWAARFAFGVSRTVT